VTDQPTCPRCGRPIRADTAYVCHRCGQQLAQDLAEAAGMVHEAQVTIARLDRFGSGGGSRSSTEPLPVNLAAAERYRQIEGTALLWSVRIARKRGHTYAIEGLADQFNWLAGQVDWLRHQPAGGLAMDDLAEACRNLRRLIDCPVPLEYAGPCNTPVDDGQACQQDLYAAPGAAFITCRECGAVHDSAGRRAWLLGQVEDRLATAATCAAAITGLGVEVTSAQVRGYAHRARLAAHGTDVHGRPLYRVGDVLDLAVEAHARRVDKAA
jgi:hypothetical protein